MSKIRVFGVFLLLGVLAGCGFRPLYDARVTESVAYEAFQRTYVAPIEDRLGTVLRAEVRRALGEKQNTQPELYTLKISVKEATQNLGVAKDATATRANLRLSAAISLRDRDDKIVYSANIVTSVSYNLLTETYATVEARHDAQRRGARELAHQIRKNLAAYFQRRAQDHGQDQSRRR